MAQTSVFTASMPSHNAKQPNAHELKQAANWQCRACGRLCRRQDETLDDFATRTGNEVDAIAAHPLRWTLHLTKLHKHSPIVLDTASEQSQINPAFAVLCGSCHRTHHNYRRWQQRRQQHRHYQEQIGQLTLSDIRLPLAGLQLSLNEWSNPYEIVNPLPPRRRTRAPRAFGDTQ
ncbi:MAG: hypothetical protein AAGI69_08975 [Cyanobacteria bacterium P01_H01_bin.21]